VGIIPLGVSALGLSDYLVWFFSPFYILAAILGLNLRPGSRVWQPQVRVITFSLLLLGLAFGTVTTFIALFIKKQGLDFNPGWFYTAAALSSFAARLIVGRHSDRYGRGVFISLSFLLYTLAMLQLARSTTLVDFLLGGSLEGAGFGILISIVAAFVADRSLPDERGRVFSICLAGLDVGIAMAGPILGYLADHIGYASTFRIGASLSGAALIVFVLGANKTIGSSLRFSLGLASDEYTRQT
jgi:MFS family permease